jgi:alpha-tubulin suppressor-like RCC1 family protein
MASNAQLYEWGQNSSGQLGDGLLNYSVLSPKLLTGKPPLPEGLNINDIQAVSCGKDHTAILTNDGYIYAAGANINGQLGIGTNQNEKTFTKCKGGDIDNIQGKIKAISCGQNYTAILTKDGYIYMLLVKILQDN